MALPVMEFQDQEYKIRKIFAQKSAYPKEIIENFENQTNEEPQQFAKIRVFKVDYFITPLFLVPKL